MLKSSVKSLRSLDAGWDAGAVGQARYEMCSGMFHALSPCEPVREFWAGNRLGTCQLSNSADEEIFLSQFLVSAPEKQDSRKQSQSIFFF